MFCTNVGAGRKLYVRERMRTICFFLSIIRLERLNGLRVEYLQSSRVTVVNTPRCLMVATVMSTYCEYTSHIYIVFDLSIHSSSRGSFFQYSFSKNLFAIISDLL